MRKWCHIFVSQALLQEQELRNTPTYVCPTHTHTHGYTEQPATLRVYTFVVVFQSVELAVCCRAACAGFVCGGYNHAVVRGNNKHPCNQC
jgi:hypothetical protein